jgi:hypothetical protein
MARDWSSIEMARRGVAEHILAWRSPFDTRNGHPLLALMPSEANARDIAHAMRRTAAAFYRESSLLRQLHIAADTFHRTGGMPAALASEYTPRDRIDALGRDARWSRFTAFAFEALADALEANAGPAKGRTDAVMDALRDIGRCCAAANAPSDHDANLIYAGKVVDHG